VIEPVEFPDPYMKLATLPTVKVAVPVVSSVAAVVLLADVGEIASLARSMVALIGSSRSLEKTNWSPSAVTERSDSAARSSAAVIDGVAVEGSCRMPFRVEARSPRPV
jgi:hypothetical protein